MVDSTDACGYVTKSSEEFRNRDALGLFGVHIEEVTEKIGVTRTGKIDG